MRPGLVVAQLAFALGLCSASASAQEPEPRRYRSRHAFDGCLLDARGELRALPTREDGDEQVLEIPPAALWGVRLTQAPSPELLAELQREEVQLLHWCATRLTPADARLIAQLPSLRALHLSCRIDDAAFPLLAPLPRLERLELNRSPGWSCPGLLKLPGLGLLRHLGIAGAGDLQGGELMALATRLDPERLESLDLSETGLFDSALTTLTHWPRLRVLRLSSCGSIGDAGVAHLSELVELNQLDLDGTRVTAKGLAALAALTRLETLLLDLRGPVLDAEALAPLQGLRGLRRLQARATPELLPWLLAQEGLRELFLEVSQLDEAALARLGTLTSLEWLWLDGVGAAGARAGGAWGSLPALRSLDLQGARLGDDFLTALRPGPRLESLALHDCPQLSDAGLAALSGLPRLEQLQLFGCAALTNASLRELATWPRLAGLSLVGAPQLTDQGLEPLRGHPRLSYLNLYDSQVSERALYLLRRTLPAADAPRGPLRVTARVGPGGGFHLSSPLGAVRDGQGLAAARRFVAQHEELHFDLDGNADPAAVQHLMGLFRETHGFWQRVTLRGGADDPQAVVPVELALERERVAQGDPLRVSIRFSGDEAPLGGKTWTLFSPSHLRLVDAAGREHSLVQRPLNDDDGTIRSKVWTGQREGVVDLSSCVEPYGGVDFVNRLPPGEYVLTFHLRVGRPQGRGPGAPVVWGPASGAPLRFTVEPAAFAPPERVQTILQEADAAIAAGRAQAAAEQLKRAVLLTGERTLIEEAIARLHRLRRVATWDLPDGSGDISLAEALAAQDDHDARRTALRFTPLHLAPAAQEAAFARYLEDLAREEELDADARDALDDVPGLFAYEPFRSFFQARLRDPTCPAPLLDHALDLPGPRDWTLLRGRLSDEALRRVLLDPQPPPRSWLRVLMTRLQDDPDQQLHDLLLLGLERAGGLDLGYEHPSGVWDAAFKARQEDRAQIQAIITVWWRRHAHEQGITPGASQTLIARREAALAAAEEVWEGVVLNLREGADGLALNLRCQRVVRGSTRPGGVRSVLVPADELAARLLERNRRLLVCTRPNPQPGDPWAQDRVDSAAGVWEVP